MYSLNKDGLKILNPCICNIIMHSETIYKKTSVVLLHNNALAFINKIVEDINVFVPSYVYNYNIKLLINHFSKIRSYSVINLK